MEQNNCSRFFQKFSLLWEILPFYGAYPLWTYLLRKLNKSTRELLNKHQNAFWRLSKEFKMKLLCFETQLNEKWYECLLNPEVLLNYKICINFSKYIPSKEEIIKFKEFLMDL